MSIDLSSDEFFQDPYPTFAHLRQTAPVFWSEAWNAWVVTRYDLVTEALKDAARFSSAGRVDYLLRQLPPAGERYRQVLAGHYEIGLAHTDPPDHTRLRRLLSRAFTPKTIEQWRPRLHELITELLDELGDAAQFDLLHDLAYPLPATLLAEMIGAPTEDIGRFRDWAVGINRLFEGGGRLSQASAQAAYESRMEMAAYITELAAQRRRQPRQDILSQLVSGEEAEQLTPDELISTLVTLFVAGHETTTNLIANGMALLLTHPEQQAVLEAHPETISDGVEEILRYEPSVPRGWRIARQPVVLGGEQIGAGQLIFPMIGAANRDPAHFDQPERFDVQRRPNKHLAFGHGIHYCIGAPLARLEATIAIGQILERFPGLVLATDQLTWAHDIAIRRLNGLPVAQD